MAVNNGIVNPYVISPKNITQYKLRRGIMDFTQIGMFDQYETGYSFLSVIKMPPYIEEIKRRSQGTDLAGMIDSFHFMLEYEFRGLSGLPDITTNTFTITDGANELNMINDVVRDTSVSVSMNFFEKRGSLITKFANYYLTGIKDPITKAKTYHGLIKDNSIEPGLENEVFTFLYYVTDNTMMRLEKAWLLCNAQLTKAEESMYDSERGQMSNKELTLEFNCYPVTGYEVDKAANKMLANLTGAQYDGSKFVAHTVNAGVPEAPLQASADTLDTTTYKFGILDESSVKGFSNPTGQSFKGTFPQD